MNRISFTGADMLVGVAAMLKHHGLDTDDVAIALGMRAPWLLVRENGFYLAGSQLYQPRWINLYLLPMGFRLVATMLPKEKVGAFLQSQPNALLHLAATKEAETYAVFTGYADKRYHFDVVMTTHCPCPKELHLTASMLTRRLTEQSTIYTLESCTPEEVDFAPLLLESLKNIDLYREDLLRIHGENLTREQLAALHEPLFRALMQELQPVTALTEDLELAAELRLLNHDYCHLFTPNAPSSLRLSERIPRSSICMCLAWLKEDVEDQLYTLGLEDEQVDQIIYGH